MTHRWTAALPALFLSAAAALPAKAATTSQMHYQDSGSVFGDPHHAQVTGIRADAYSGGAYAGAFRLTSDVTGDIVAFCIDLAQRIADGGRYVANQSVLSQGHQDRLDRLFTSAYRDVDTAVEGAGFQLAIWEIITEDETARLDLTDGAFSAYHNDAAIAVAQGYLDGLDNAASGGYRLSFYQSDNHQDVMTVAPVPLPAGAVFLITGLGALALNRRRRGAKA